MEEKGLGPLKLYTTVEEWPLLMPFRITGRTFATINVLLVCVEKSGCIGRGEAAGVYYKNDQPDAMIQQIETLRQTLESGASRESIQAMLPAGGARNALDCALWDLEAKLSVRSAWALMGLPAPRPLLTTFTCGADSPEVMANVARNTYAQARAIKLKLTGEAIDTDRVRAVREARPDVWLGVDANQGFSPTFLERVLPAFQQMRVELIEQPFPVGQEVLLRDLQSPIPIAADESAQCRSDLRGLVGYFDVVNIKLDKCGGLTEGLAMARLAHELGFATMVGNMIGTSLAMAPAFLLGQLCEVVDLDGPVFLKGDRIDSVRYENGFISCHTVPWG